jgi:hypothetical protein
VPSFCAPVDERDPCGNRFSGSIAQRLAVIRIAKCGELLLDTPQRLACRGMATNGDAIGEDVDGDQTCLAQSRRPEDVAVIDGIDHHGQVGSCNDRGIRSRQADGGCAIFPADAHGAHQFLVLAG